MILIPLTILLIALVPDLYIQVGFLRHAGLLWTVLHWLPFTVMVLATLTAAMGVWHNGAFQTFIGLLLITVVPKYIFMLCSLAGKGMGMLYAPAACAGNAIGLAAAAAAVAAALYGMTFGWRNVVVNRTEIETEGLPEAFDGYTIVQLSDMHIGTYRHSPATVREIVERVNALQPDIIFFTGDIVNLSSDELRPFTAVLSQLRARDGVHSVLGNHDYCLYGHRNDPAAAAQDLGQVILMERQMGWNLLLNGNITLRRGTDSIAVAGVENSGGSHFPSRADLPGALQGLAPGTFKILLSHDPSHWRREVLRHRDINLTLSGHTHAMQLMIGSFSPSRWIYPEWGGLYSEDHRLLHVSTGIGSNVPFRLGASPEICVLTLRTVPRHN